MVTDHLLGKRLVIICPHAIIYEGTKYKMKLKIDFKFNGRMYSIQTDGPSVKDIAEGFWVDQSLKYTGEKKYYIIPSLIHIIENLED